MQRYTNTKKYLDENKYTLLTLFTDDFLKNNTILIKCENNHEIKLNLKTFDNKKNKIHPSELCSDCKKENKKNIRFLELKEKILTKSGHTLTSYINNTHILYTCGSCLSENNKTNVSSIYANTGVCSKCSKEKSKNNVEDVKKDLLKHGFTLIKYHNIKQIEVSCENLHKRTIVLTDILNRNRKCPICRVENKL